MGFRFRRSVKIFPGVRLNFGTRGISTSIGFRGAHVTYGPSGTRTTVGLPGTGLSYTHLEKSRRQVSTMAAELETDPGIPEGSARRGYVWIGLLVAGMAIGIVNLLTPAPPVQAPAPVQTLTPTTVVTAAAAAAAERSAQIKRAALGLSQIRRQVANSNTLRLSRVTVMPGGATCYQLHLKNSRGVAYVRTAVMDGSDLHTSGSAGFPSLWNRLCADTSRGQEITAAVESVMKVAPE